MELNRPETTCFIILCKCRTMAGIVLCAIVQVCFVLRSIGLFIPIMDVRKNLSDQSL